MHKLLFDNNISHRVLPHISKEFVDSTHVMLKNLDYASDLEVWSFAKENDYTIVTKDSDFNDLAILKGTPPKVIWIKLGNCSVPDIVKILKDNGQTIKVFLNEEDSAILEI
ncbi:MAG: hypothetical protein COA92_04700 [Sulfurovum sp.]|nr:MAG: hypothetical protein COA92_04700 [Sulfurovum sp.]